MKQTKASSFDSLTDFTRNCLNVVLDVMRGVDRCKILSERVYMWESEGKREVESSYVVMVQYMCPRSFYCGEAPGTLSTARLRRFTAY